MIKNLFKNLLYRAEADSTTKANTAEQNAKDYSISLRYLDYANAISPLSSGQTSAWTYTVPKDGVLIIDVLTQTRAYLEVTINNISVTHIAHAPLSGQSDISPHSFWVKEGDVFNITGLANTASLMQTTKLIPFVIGGGN